MAGSASITSHMCTKLGHPSIVLVDDHVDAWDHGEYYQNTIRVKPNEDLIGAIKKMRDSFDHIVYHDRVTIAKELDSLHIPSSYFFHGNDLRQQPKIYDVVWSMESIDNIFVTTEDLLQYAPEAYFFRRPVDLDLFKFKKMDKITGALCMTQERYYDEVVEITKDFDLPVQIVDRVNHRVRYKDMPLLLNSYRCYYDIKFQPKHPPVVIPELSQTALQALACGTNVFSNGVLFTKFPEEHSDENACREFISVLEE